MSSRSLNKVLLIGNLTFDPELRYTPQGTAVCTFGVATNRSWTNSTGQQQEEVEFHRIVAWQKLAELCSQLLFKGRKVFVEGRLQTRKWTGQDGQERKTTETVIDNMIILDSKRREGEGVYAEGMVGTKVAPAQTAVVNDQLATPAVSAPVAVDDVDADKAASDKKIVQDKPVEETKRESKKETEKKEDKKGGKNEEVKAEDIPF